MTQELWSAVDRYINDLFEPPDAALTAALQASSAANLRPINVSPNQGHFLQLLARALGARNILEIGTLGGYSTIWLARALPAGGRLITLEHNACSPEPYDRINLIAGVKGIFRDFPPRIFLDGISKGTGWDSIDSYVATFDHPMWKELGKHVDPQDSHGGMDLVMCRRVIDWFKEGLAPDMDVYDAATWSAPGPLSEMSIRQGSEPVPFPDFTRGRWKRLSADAARASITA